MQLAKKNRLPLCLSFVHTLKCTTQDEDLPIQDIPEIQQLLYSMHVLPDILSLSPSAEEKLTRNEFPSKFSQIVLKEYCEQMSPKSHTR